LGHLDRNNYDDVRLKPSKFWQADLDWLHHRNLLDDAAYAKLSTRSMYGCAPLVRRFACTQIGARPVTGPRFPAEIEKAVVAVRDRDFEFLRRRPSQEEMRFPGRRVGPWVDSASDPVAYITETREGWRLEFFPYAGQDLRFSPVNIIAIEEGVYSCRGLRLHRKEWWEIVAAFCGRMMTAEEALAELDRTRPADLR
jgi:hypothetical protein